jgi:hypothetical protein
MSPEPIQLLGSRPDWSKSVVLGERGDAAREFADLVATQLVGTVLPWTRREALVHLAGLRGIGRFDANLIIAAVQHQLGVGRKRIEIAKRKRTLRTIAEGFAFFIIVQAGIVGMVWHWLL